MAISSAFCYYGVVCTRVMCLYRYPHIRFFVQPPVSAFLYSPKYIPPLDTPCSSVANSLCVVFEGVAYT